MAGDRRAQHRGVHLGARLGENGPTCSCVSRTAAADIARAALAARGVTLGPQWRVLPVPDDGSGGPHEFVSETAGEERRRQLLGMYLPEPRWRVRDRDVRGRRRRSRRRVAGLRHRRPARSFAPSTRCRKPGPAQRSTRTPRAQRAVAIVTRDFGLDIAGGTLPRSVGASSQAEGANRLDVHLRRYLAATVAARRAANRGRDCRRRGDRRAPVRLRSRAMGTSAARDKTRNLIVRIIVGVVFGGLLVSAAVAGVVAWSRRRYTPRLFLAATGIMFAVTLAAAANAWPSSQALFVTEIPLPIQLLGAIGIGLVALIINSALAGLALGAQPARLEGSGTPAARETRCCWGARSAHSPRRSWRWPDRSGRRRGLLPPASRPSGTFVPAMAVALEPLAGFLTRVAVMLSLLTGIHHATLGWTRRRALSGAVVVLVGFLGAGAPAGSQLAGWAAAGAVLGIGPARRLCDGPSHRSDDGPDGARRDDGDWRTRPRDAAAVSRRAARCARRRRAHGSSRVVVFSGAPPLASTLRGVEIGDA